MAKSKFEYVRSFEMEDRLEPLHWIVLHLQCLEHAQFVASQEVTCSSDAARLENLMSVAAMVVMREFKEISISYGYSNIFNFIFKMETPLYKRRASKLLTTVASQFSSSFISKWKENVPMDVVSLLKENVPMNVVSLLPVFESSIYLLPQNHILQEFLIKEQNACHIHNLDETTFRNLIKVARFDPAEAAEKLKFSSVSEKNEMLFSLCNINYNNEPPKSKKGSILLQKSREKNFSAPLKCEDQEEEESNILEVHEDFSKIDFWNNYFPLDSLTQPSCKNSLNLFKRTINILPHTWLVVRIDGKGFHKFSEKHNFVKPNDERALRLMNSCAELVMKRFPNIIISYGQSDEYSFVLRRYNHREKEGYSLISRIVSMFGIAYVHLWESEFDNQTLMYPPAFDARLVLYPTNSAIRDYLSWRQADCHINNMYNLCFWKLVQEKCLSRKNAQQHLKGTFTKDKLSILLNEFNIIYEQEDVLFRKGTVIYISENSDGVNEAQLVKENLDIINDNFWATRPWLLGNEYKAKDGIDSL